MDAFWRLTPRLLQLALKAGYRRRNETYRGFIFLAWHIAGLERTKRLPRLNKLMPRPDGKPAPPKSDDQMLAIARMWDAKINAAKPPRAKPQAKSKR